MLTGDCRRGGKGLLCAVSLHRANFSPQVEVLIYAKVVLIYVIGSP